jgi:alcohol dehydrogenase (cytochrome c)
MFLSPRVVCRNRGVAVVDTRWIAWTAAALVLTVVAAPARGQTPLGFTEEQAEAGSAVYAERCASCHGDTLDDGEVAPPLKGAAFRERWRAETPDTLFNLTADTMPQDQPGVLDDASYAAVLAFMYRENGSAAGADALPADPDILAGLTPPRWPRGQGGGLAPGAALPPYPVSANPLPGLRPVTDQMLEQPDPGDWLLWRRTYDASGFSPLEAINRTNVDDLRVAWSWSLPAGPNESTPIVHDGVLFIHGYGDEVQALDAATGDLLWQYSRRLPRGTAPSVKRGMSLYGGRLYVPTSDAHIVALEARTGRVVWDKPAADREDGYRMTGGTLVARGKVMVGTTGRVGGGNYIVALDAETGDVAWRFATIAQPDTPGGNSWNGLPVEARNGGSVWIPGSYDPVNNLAFFAPGNTYDTGPLRDPVSTPGVTNDALYLDTTLALNPDTGELVWHFQHQANGQWDLDWAFERQIVDLTVGGESRRLVVTTGKQAIFDFLDADTGAYVSSIDLGLQNLVTAIDPVTGAKTTDPALLPGDGETKMVCPHVSGGRGWMPTSYDARTKVVYVPMVEACMDLVPVPDGERGSLSSGVRWTVRPRPESDGNYGRLEAVNLETGDTTWIARQRAPQTTGTLVTAGGLVFAGALDRRIAAYDADTGEQLWQTRLNEVPSAAPITYAVAGRQYLAVIVGSGGYQSGSYGVMVPEIKNPPGRGASLWVFEVK